MKLAGALIAMGMVGCYTGAPANRDVQRSWERRTVGEIHDRWGGPRATDPTPDGSLQTWTFDRIALELPGGNLEMRTRSVTANAGASVPGGAVGLHLQGSLLGIAGQLHPGSITHVTHAAVALVDPAGSIVGVDGEALHWGPPNDANLHWGAILGVHVGMGGLDNASSPLPSGGAYIGGMLNPTLGLVGTYDVAFGTGDAGSAMGMAGGLALQWWPINRVWLRAGPAMLLTLEPGFSDAALKPGGTVGASWAFVKVGVLAVDLRADLVAGPGTTFGSVGIGVNVN
ncbi:MAG TPA: hypothetical protein VGM90_23060 [Kofleriaceae bacterium]|jgi:hypothetical protein